MTPEEFRKRVDESKRSSYPGIVSGTVGKEMWTWMPSGRSFKQKMGEESSVWKDIPVEGVQENAQPIDPSLPPTVWEEERLNKFMIDNLPEEGKQLFQEMQTSRPDLTDKEKLLLIRRGLEEVNSLNVYPE